MENFRVKISIERYDEKTDTYIKHVDDKKECSSYTIMTMQEEEIVPNKVYAKGVNVQASGPRLEHLVMVSNTLSKMVSDQLPSLDNTDDMSISMVRDLSQTCIEKGISPSEFILTKVKGMKADEKPDIDSLLNAITNLGVKEESKKEIRELLTDLKDRTENGETISEEVFEKASKRMSKLVFEDKFGFSIDDIEKHIDLSKPMDEQTMQRVADLMRKKGTDSNH